jgi:hypothetical protein
MDEGKGDRMPADKIDLVRLHKSEYVATRKPVLITTRSAKYLAIGGSGTPGDRAFQAQIGALYAVAFTLKMTKKFAGEADYKVCPLEGLYWGPHRIGEPGATDWNWKLLIRVPDFITAKDLRAAATALEKKGKTVPAGDVTLEKLREGRCVQMLHVGSYASEKNTIDQMLAFGEANGVTPNGRHHEIYLSDPRRVPPERLRTILRQPVG